MIFCFFLHSEPKIDICESQAFWHTVAGGNMAHPKRLSTETLRPYRGCPWYLKLLDQHVLLIFSTTLIMRAEGRHPGILWKTNNV